MTLFAFEQKVLIDKSGCFIDSADEMTWKTAPLKQNRPHRMAPVEKRKVTLIALLLAVTVVALYWPARHFDFVQYDDNEYVFDNPDVSHGLSWWGVAWSFVDAHASNYHPLTWLSHMLDCQLFGLHAGPHHVVNVLFHAVNAVLLFLLLRSMTNMIWRSAFVASVFALHPLRVESVAWISERKDLLSGLFFMLTLWAYVEYVKTASEQSATATSKSFSFLQKAKYRISLTCFLLGLMSKPMLVTVPAVLLIIDFWPLNRFGSRTGSASRIFTIPKSLLLEKIPFLALAIVFGLLTIFAQKTGGALKTAEFSTRISNMLCAYAAYLGKLFWPHDLSVIYLRPDHLPIARILGAFVLLLAITIFILMNMRRRPYLLTGWLWFVVTLLPVSGLVTIGDNFMADRYTYLPAIGLSLALVWGAMDLSSTMFSPRHLKLFATANAVIILIACTILSRIQLRYWPNTETLMTHALKIDPDNFVAHINLGVYYGKHGNLNAARFHRERAVALAPRTSDKRNSH